MAMNVKGRVGAPGQSFGLLTQQIAVLHRDLLAFRKRTEQRFDRIDARFDNIDHLEGKLDSLDRKIDAKVDGLARSLPGIVRDVVSDYEIKSKKR